MRIFLSGSDSFLAKKAIDEIKRKYLAKNDGAELIEINGDEPLTRNLADLQAVPLFATSRLVIFRQVSQFAKDTQDTLAAFLKNLPETTVVVVWDGKALPAGSALKTVLESAEKVIPVEPLEGVTLKNFIKKQAMAAGFEITAEQISDLAASFGSDLWSLESELNKMSHGASHEKKTRIEDEKFIYFRLIRSNDWKGIKKQLARDLKQGVPIELTVGMLASAIRKELRSSEDKLAITNLMIDLDYGLKTGWLDDAAVTALLISHLPKPSLKRVVWEVAWQGKV